MCFKSFFELKMTWRLPRLWMLLVVLAFVPGFDSITNSDGPATGRYPQHDVATLDPEELLHDVIPCTCVDIRLCPNLLDSLKHPIRASSAEIRHLQRFTCGFRGFTPFVCCNEMANTPMERPHQNGQQPTQPMAVDTPTQYPHVTNKPVGDTSFIYNANRDRSSNNPRPNVPYDSTTIPIDSFDFTQYKPSSTPIPSDFADGITKVIGNERDLDPVTPPTTYYPADDIDKTFGTGSGSATSPTNYDPSEDIAKTFGTGHGPVPVTPPSNYDPSEDIAKTFGTGHGPVPVTPPSNYDPSEDIATTFGTGHGPVPVTPPSNYDPSEDIAKTFGTGSGSGTSPSNYDPSEDIAKTFGTGSGSGTPPSNYDPSEDIAKTFGTGHGFESVTPSSKYDPKDDKTKPSEYPGDYFSNNPSTPRGTYDPSDDITKTFGDSGTKNNPSMTPDPYGHRDDTSTTLGSSGIYHNNDPTSPLSTYDPTDDISNVFGSPNMYSKTSPSTTPSYYDPRDDITKTFARPNGYPNNNPSLPPLPRGNVDGIANPFSNRPGGFPTLSPNPYRPSENIPNTFGFPAGSVSQPSDINTVRPLFPHQTARPFIPMEDQQRNLTEFKFHLETKLPSGNLTIHLNRLPFQGGQKNYDIPLATETSYKPVTYNVDFQTTNMEKKYLEFKEFFFKNLNKSKGHPIVKSITNVLHPYYGNHFVVTTAPVTVNHDTDYNNQKKFLRDNNPDVLRYLFRAPRSTSTNRYVRHPNPPGTYRFPSGQSQPQYFPSNTAVPHPYFTTSSNHPYYAGSSNHKLSSIYPHLNYKPTPAPDYDYDDYSDTAKPNQYAYHHMHNRGIGRGWVNNTPKRKPINNDGAIIFPNDDDDEPPKNFQHYQPNSDSAYYPGPFFNGRHHHPSRPQFSSYPHWGFNHGHRHPGHHHHNMDYDSDEETYTNPPRQTGITITTIPPASPSPDTSPTPDSSETETITVTTPMTPVTVIVSSNIVNATAAATAATAGSDLVTKIAVNPGPSEGRQSKRLLLPNDACGVSVDERIIGGKAAAIGAFPWIARIGYVRPGSDRVLYRCAGTLINSIYIMTAAHCITNLPVGLTLTSVLLGELDEATDPDCNGNECADPVQNFSPAEILVHSSYDTPQFKNDVGLIRLDRTVNMSTYVSPICLPFDSLSTKDYTGLKATVAGWGASNVGAPSANPILQWVRLTIVPLAQCAATFSSRSGVDVGVGQLCAGGVLGRDSCEGDSGGPLMRPEQPDADSSPRYFLIGIVSFGAKRCGSDNMPGVYTNVASYLDWILENIKA